MNDILRKLPSVEELTSRLEARAGRVPRALIVAEVRRVLDSIRKELREGRGDEFPDVEGLAEAGLAELLSTSLERVINATGVILHTNLGRAPLGGGRPMAGYSNLEYDLAEGRRGRRDVHVAGLLERLLGAPAIAVNNNAAAVYLALKELAGEGEVIVSRGELIEIGDGFRIPDILQASGAVMREVGTTNRTGLEDYRAAITPRTRLLLRVHRSNFRMSGFTAQPELGPLAGLAHEHGLQLFEDLGSGCLTDLREFGIDEPLAADSLRAGVDLISFSGDKLLGGPQAGILAGNAGLITRLRRNPMYRALRLDKLVYQALEGTLRDTLLER
ncbi:MAG: L-seryl-tRNA(Sec) selenium transferase, partial [Acidobacteria bacterium]|nr:L-seryl-tRNA(Sec) selenium transferase [Acidobacteriota bacterium]